MNTNELLDYESPQVQLIEVTVEEGYAGSMGSGGENGNWQTSSCYEDFYE